MRTRFALLSALSVVLVPFASVAQEPEAASPDGEEASIGSDFEDEGAPLEQDTTEGQVLDDAPGETPPAAEEEKEATHLIGARYRMIIVPQFLINMFGVDGATTAVVHGLGVEYGYSKKHFEIMPSVWWAGYYMDQTPFKGPNDGDEAWELVASDVNMIYLTVDFMWKHPLTKGLALHVGAGAGVGITTGTLTRNEANWLPPASPALPGDPYTQLAPCQGPGVASTGVPNTLECPLDGSYGVDDPWPVYPWLTFQTGLRYSPVKQFVGRLDLGVGSSGFWLGLGADYGI